MSDRHHIHDASLPWTAGATRRRGTILIRIGEADAATSAGQHAVWMMVNMAARLNETVERVVVDAPQVALLSPAVAPFSESDDLRDALLASGRAIGAGVDVVPLDGQPRDVVLEYGARPSDGVGWCVSANGWVGAISRNGDRLPPTHDANPMGAYVAASLAVAEAFKMLVEADDRADRAENLALNLWSLTTTPCRDAATTPEQNPPWRGADIGDVYVAGSGAVANAIHHIWLALPNLVGASIPVDRADKKLKETNLNRYALATRDALGKDKAVVLQRRLEGRATIRVLPRTRGWNTLRNEPGSELDETDPIVRRLAEQERRNRFATVLNCVDRDNDRADVQESFPRDLFQGSTLFLRAQCSRFDLSREENACTKCFTRPEDDLEIDDDLAERLVKMDAGERAAYARERDILPEKVEAWLEKRCATLSAAQITSLRETPVDPPEWSVSFVSVMAGILQATEHLKHAFGRPTRAGQSYAVRYFFTFNSLTVTELTAELACECRTTGFRRTWSRKWS